jgi:hypothetical protein
MHQGSGREIAIGDLDARMQPALLLDDFRR